MATDWILIETVAAICIEFISIMFLCWITYKIYSNLYEFSAIYCGEITICCIEFSDKFNWIIEPSKSNKIYALFCSIFITLFYIIRCFRNILDFIIQITYTTYYSIGIIE